MSSRQTGRLYTQHSNLGASLFGGGQGAGGLQNPGLLAQLFGQGNMTGGLAESPETGELAFSPYKGSSGIFGGASRNNAAAMNLQMGGQQLQMQGLQDIQSQAAQQAQQQSMLEQKMAIATKHDVPMDKLDSILSDLLQSNAVSNQRNISTALNNPANQNSYNNLITGANNAQSAQNSQLMGLNAPMGGIAAKPDLTGNYISATGSVPTQNTSLAETGMMIPGTNHRMNITPVVNQGNIPARLNVPNPGLFQQATQMQPPTGANVTPTKVVADTADTENSENPSGASVTQGITPTGVDKSSGGMNPYVKAYLQFILGQAGNNLKGLVGGNLGDVSY